MNNMFRNTTIGLYSVSPYIGYSTIHFWLFFNNLLYKQKYCFIKSTPGRESLTSFSYTASSVILVDAVALVSPQGQVCNKCRQSETASYSFPGKHLRFHVSIVNEYLNHQIMLMVNLISGKHVLTQPVHVTDCCWH